jgi:hypothetical protein
VKLALAPSESVTWNRSARGAAEGSSDVFSYVTERIAAW